MILHIAYLSLINIHSVDIVEKYPHKRGMWTHIIDIIDSGTVLDNITLKTLSLGENKNEWAYDQASFRSYVSVISYIWLIGSGNCSG